MDTLNLHIYNLDDEIIELLSIRQELLTNSKNFKVMELGGYNMKDNFISKLDHNIFNYEVKFENKKIKNYLMKIWIIQMKIMKH